MKYISKITGKSYKDKESIWIKNLRQAARFIKHGATILDIVVAKHSDDMAIVFDREEIAPLMALWNEYKLD